MTNKEKLSKLRKLGEKYSKASEFFDSIIANNFVPMRFPTKGLINQIGNEVLDIIDDRKPK